MYISTSMLAAKNGCSIATVSRILREMEQSGRYPTAIKRCGKMTVNDEDFEDYIRRRKRKRRGEA